MSAITLSYIVKHATAQTVSKPPANDEEYKVSGILKNFEGAAAPLIEADTAKSAIKNQLFQKY